MIDISQFSQDDDQEEEIVDGGGDNLHPSPSYDKIEKYTSNQPTTASETDPEEESTSLLSQPTNNKEDIDYPTITTISSSPNLLSSQDAMLEEKKMGRVLDQLINSQTNHPSSKNTPNKNNNNNYIKEDERNILLDLALLPQEQESGNNHPIDDEIPVDPSTTNPSSTSSSFQQILDMGFDPALSLTFYEKCQGSENLVSLAIHDLMVVSLEELEQSNNTTNDQKKWA